MAGGAPTAGSGCLNTGDGISDNQVQGSNICRRRQHRRSLPEMAVPSMGACASHCPPLDGPRRSITALLGSPYSAALARTVRCNFPNFVSCWGHARQPRNSAATYCNMGPWPHKGIGGSRLGEDPRLKFRPLLCRRAAAADSSTVEQLSLEFVWSHQTNNIENTPNNIENAPI